MKTFIVSILPLIALGCAVEDQLDPSFDIETRAAPSSNSSCGGFPGTRCPRGEVCVDDPSDDCDPQSGGADCIGLCVEPVFCGGFAGIPCAEGEICVDDPTDDCDPQSGGADCSGLCVPDPDYEPEPCGGFAGLPCPDGLVCVDDPSDDCDPLNGGADCIGICVSSDGSW